MSKLAKARIAAVVVAVLEAKKRIPTGFKTTYFSEHDLWIYHLVMDDRLCVTCQTLGGPPASYSGDMIRGVFPYLEITGDLIHVNVHPNCRCYLSRSVKPLEEPEER